MSADRAEAVESTRRRRSQRAAPHVLQLAEQPARNHIARLVDLTTSLMHEIDNLARDQAFVNSGGRFQALLRGVGIDLFEEVERFEINLITLALKQTNGHQARAAKLLNINPTTLNSKIKVYGIEY